MKFVFVLSSKIRNMSQQSGNVMFSITPPDVGVGLWNTRGPEQVTYEKKITLPEAVDECASVA